jgi:apolipoprotein D and lipocalin family protein
MKIILLIFLITAALTAQEKINVKTVEKVDLNKYVGLWYEIGRLPNRFQDKCVKNVTAEYSLREDGKISVVNSCVEDNGEIDVAEGNAKINDAKTNSKLKVSFVSFLGINLFYGDYWIIGLADDYSYAVVGTPNHKYAWILSRTKQLPEDKLREAMKILTDNGFNTNNIKMTKQD